MPEMYLFGGCNGAGKTTAAMRLLPAMGCTNFVNADLLARGLAPLGGDVDFEAAALMMRRLRKLRDGREDFGTESTLASRTLAPFTRECRARGYRLHLFYLSLPSAEMAVQRVAARVRSGGHDVPPETIRRRYESGRLNFRDAYRAEADTWRAYDNSLGAKLVARGGKERETEIFDVRIWKEMIR